MSETGGARPPNPPNPLATAEPWDLVSDGYVDEALPYFESFSRAALQVAALPPGARVVDVATGPGTLALLAASDGATVSAIDISERMIAALRARAARAGLSEAIDVRLGDAQRLPFETAAYDAAFSMFGLMFFPDRATGLREMRRVLRPGRRAVVSSWVPFEGPFAELLKAAREFIPGLPLGGGRPPLSSPEEIRAELEHAGFDSVMVETASETLSAPSFDAFWSSMQRTNAPLALLKQRLGQRWDEAAPKIRERVRATLGEGPLVIGRGAYLGIGTAP
ncbi:MAG TPA: methyltransferase domain-containing protein [Polyangiaceae bacterium]|nr:methyltransferase domain-containing protein [Polyangiaceae bacterium]